LKIELISSAVGSGELSSQFLTSIRVNDSVCLDAGSIGFHAEISVQKQIRHVFISHSHIDHTASLPILLDNVFGAHPEGVAIYASAEVELALREDMFNDRTWPDFFRISDESPKQLLTFHRLLPNSPVQVEGLKITPISVDHVVPTFAFIIDDGITAAVVATDTGPCESLWPHANAIPHLNAVFLEASFPEELSWLAGTTKHLTPTLFSKEIKKLTGDPQIFALHLKATHRREIIAQLDKAGVDQIIIMEPDKIYEI